MEEQLPSRLKEARKRLGLNQLEIALDLDIQQKSISDIENGKIHNIPNKYIYYFYQKGISLEWIYDGKGAMLKDEYTAPLPEEMTIDDLLVENKLQTTDEEKTIKKEEKQSQPGYEINVMFERLIESKDFNIKSLLSYIKSLENNLEYVKNLLNNKLTLNNNK